MENLEIGLLLMVVGMATVFVILLIVIYLSQLLIKLVNKVAPEEEPKKKAVSTVASSDASAMDAIKAAVNILTAGKGQVIKIEKLR
ncbi:OadG family protein [uncultured Phocaeicola sp.]|jgi:oxaloacetate decarboxylase gamma subunit|uniref:OadG family protein n=1 Tax=uncultured Phocaeicola sp. TaxID=990718 RepID=UPI0015AE274A|nr:OadG family protein [uncultured Phocaeicola sp.]